MNKFVNSVCITWIRVKLHTYIKLIPYFNTKQRPYIPYVLWTLNQCLTWPTTKPRYCINKQKKPWLAGTAHIVSATTNTVAPSPLFTVTAKNNWGPKWRLSFCYINNVISSIMIHSFMDIISLTQCLFIL